MRTPTLSPTAAAHHAQVSRRTITRAIQAGELQAVRDNRNAWRIRLEDLDAWLTARVPTHAQGTPTAHAQDMPTHAHPDAHLLGELRTEAAELRARIQGLEARLADKDALIADLRQDRDAWRRQAERGGGGFWAWLRGLGR